MKSNRRRNQNQVPIRALSPWLIMLLIGLIGGLTWVYLSNQQIARGREISKLEKQLEGVRKEIDGLRSPIATLSSRTALQKRLNDGFIKMVPITTESIVQVNYNRPSNQIAMAADEIVPVSNTGVRR